MANKLSISLVVYNGAAYLPYCLDSIFNQKYNQRQIFILDNGSSDNSLAIIKEISSGRSNVIILPPEPANIGFAAGHNKIIKLCRSEFILLLNQDVILEPDYIAALINFMEANLSVGAAAGKILRWNFKYAAKSRPFREYRESDNVNSLEYFGKGRDKLTSAGKTDIIDTTGLRLFRSGRVADRGAGEQDRGQYDATQEAFGVSGCLPLYRLAALRQVGCLDEHFFSYQEDVDLAFRLQASGWQAWRVGSAVAYHDRSIGGNETSTLIDAVANRRRKPSWANYFSYRNHLFILIKDWPAVDFARYGIFICWYELKKFLYILLLEQRSLWAWIEVISQLPRLLRERKALKPPSVKRWIK
ncbi:hypothetical protein COU01_00445 [Candidatus Falkowbacteria bacterium CG10_big_fil_rev_8_21_14_0_10_44_15]|uniref:Glycosyltransferase 2-like domain-containing protein n=1 Tax=Candidatus Falkowbacteria bacterium CG10_big_fil_rev_8_21_14_0_10_44_15 TaxID=1974569 RepID=A0A2H0V0V0_9BACT|nr:MAG: hypothetical protein COU01_00445 [Candidatus Falkowbacteria bacterium CG10_big_fil_rev_8_21_14_0_10_44_15]